MAREPAFFKRIVVLFLANDDTWREHSYLWQTKAVKGTPADALGAGCGCLVESPTLGQEALAVLRVALTENGALPVMDAGFGKVSKQLLCLDTFSIHPWTVVTFHELGTDHE